MTEQSIHQDEEIWKPAFGFEGFYEISNFGRVKALPRTINTYGVRSFTRKEEILSPVISNKGYLEIRLQNGKQRKSVKVHRLVAIAFVPGYKEGLSVNHKDGNPLNNSIGNLEFITHRENCCHGRNSKEKYIGTSYNKTRGHWCAYVTINKKHKYLGSFPTQEMASDAYRKFLEENGIENKYVR